MYIQALWKTKSIVPILLQGGWSPLMWASYKGHEEIVSLLLEKGADVHAHGNYNIKYVYLREIII